MASSDEERKIEAMSESNGGGGTVDSILGNALDELYERRNRVQPFVDELHKIDGAIKVLERAGSAHARAGTPPTRKRRDRKPEVNGDLRERVIAELGRSLDPMTPGEIGEKLGGLHGAGVAACLRRAAEDGLVVQVEGGWGLPANVDTETSSGALT